MHMYSPSPLQTKIGEREAAPPHTALHGLYTHVFLVRIPAQINNPSGLEQKTCSLLKAQQSTHKLENKQNNFMIS